MMCAFSIALPMCPPTALGSVLREVPSPHPPVTGAVSAWTTFTAWMCPHRLGTGLVVCYVGVRWGLTPNRPPGALIDSKPESPDTICAQRVPSPLSRHQTGAQYRRPHACAPRRFADAADIVLRQPPLQRH